MSAERGDGSPRTLVVGDVVQLALDAAAEAPLAKDYSLEPFQP
jgi:hypothetical protein